MIRFSLRRPVGGRRYSSSDRAIARAASAASLPDTLTAAGRAAMLDPNGIEPVVDVVFERASNRLLRATDVALIAAPRTLPGYANKILPDAPAAYYRLNETSGTTAADSSGNGRNATWTAAPTSTAGLLAAESDAAVSLAADRSASTASGTGLDSNAFTLEAIVQPTSSGNGIAARWSDTAAAQVWYLQYLSSGAIRLGVKSSGGAITTLVTPTGVLPMGSTSHLAVVVTGGTATFYVNGTSVYSAAAPATIAAVPTTPLYIAGVNSSSTFRFAGVLDEVVYYTTGLSAAQVAAHAQEAANGSTGTTNVGVDDPAMLASDVVTNRRNPTRAFALADVAVVGSSYVFDRGVDDVLPVAFDRDHAGLSIVTDLLCPNPTGAFAPTNARETVSTPAAGGVTGSYAVLSRSTSPGDAGRLIPSGSVWYTTAATQSGRIEQEGRTLCGYRVTDATRTRRFTVAADVASSEAIKVAGGVAYKNLDGTGNVYRIAGPVTEVPAGVVTRVVTTFDVTMTASSVLTEIAPYLGVTKGGTSAARIEVQNLHVYAGEPRPFDQGLRATVPTSAYVYAELTWTDARKVNRVEVSGDERGGQVTAASAAVKPFASGGSWGAVPLGAGGSSGRVAIDLYPLVNSDANPDVYGVRVWVEETNGGPGSPVFLDSVDPMQIEDVSDQVASLDASWSRETDPGTVTDPFGNYEASTLEVELDDTDGRYNPATNTTLDVGHRIEAAVGVRYGNRLGNPRAEDGPVAGGTAPVPGWSGTKNLPIVNLLTNPRAGTNTTGWATYAGTGGTAATSRVATGGPDDGPFVRGTWSVSATSGTGGPNTSGMRVQLVAGRTYTYRGWVRSSRATRVAIYLERSQLVTGGTYYGNVTGPGVVVAANVWTEVTATYTADASTAGQWLNASTYTTPGTGFGGNPQAGDLLDAIGTLTDNGDPGAYFDGSTLPGEDRRYEWTGTPHASTSRSIQSVGASTNLVTNPRAVGTAGWYARGDATIASEATITRSAGGSLKVTMGPAPNADHGLSSGQDATQAAIRVQAGRTYSLGVWVRGAAASNVWVGLIFRDSAGTYLAAPTSAQNVPSSSTDWQRREVTATAPSTAVIAQLFVAGPASSVFYVDDVTLAAGSTPLDYAGDTASTYDLGYAWSGTANASVSTRSRTSPPVEIMDSPGTGFVSGRLFRITGEVESDRVVLDPAATQVRVSGWLRTDTVGVPFGFSAAARSLDGTGLETSAAVTVDSTAPDWQYRTVTLTPAAGHTLASLLFTGGVGWSTLLSLEFLDSTGTVIRVEELLPAGVFYSDPYETDSRSPTVSISAADKLGRLSGVTVDEPVRLGATVGDLVAEVALRYLDLDADQVSVGPTPAGTVVPYAYAGGVEVGSYLADLVKAAVSTLHVDATERLTVARRNDGSEDPVLEVRADNALRGHKRPPGYDVTTSIVTVNAAPLAPVAAPVELWAMPSGGITVPTGATYDLVTPYSSTPALAVAVTGVVTDGFYNLTATLGSFRGIVRIENLESRPLVVADLRVTGKPLEETPLSTRVEDAASRRRYGPRELTVDARLIQTQGQLDAAAAVLLDAFRAIGDDGVRRSPDLVLDTLGVMFLEAGDKISVSDPDQGLGSDYAILARRLVYEDGAVLLNDVRVREASDVAFAVVGVSTLDSGVVAGY